MVDGGADPGGRGAPETVTEGRAALSLALYVAAGFVAACLVVHVLAARLFYGPLSASLWVTPYAEDAGAVLRGLVPYRDFALEYPPLSLPVFILPAIGDPGVPAIFAYEQYRTAFEVLIALIGAGLAAVTVVTVARLGADRTALVVSAVLLAASPLLIGSLTLSRYDLWPALLTAGAMAATLHGRRRLGFALLACGTLAKVYPAFLVPLFLIEAWKNAGRREAAVGLGIVVAIGAAVTAPFVLADPTTALDPYLRTLPRPLQIESLGSAALIVLHHYGDFRLDPAVASFGSDNLVGALPDRVAQVQSLVMFGGTALVYLLALRGPLGPRRLALAAAAVLVVEVAFDKVFSPQYVIWLLGALVLLVPARGFRPVAALLAILVLTAAYYPWRYTLYVRYFDQASAVIVLARDLVVVAVAVWLVWQVARRDRDPFDAAAVARGVAATGTA